MIVITNGEIIRHLDTTSTPADGVREEFGDGNRRKFGREFGMIRGVLGDESTLSRQRTCVNNHLELLHQSKAH